MSKVENFAKIDILLLKVNILKKNILILWKSLFYGKMLWLQDKTSGLETKSCLAKIKIFWQNVSFFTKRKVLIFHENLPTVSLCGCRNKLSHSFVNFMILRQKAWFKSKLRQKAAILRQNTAILWKLIFYNKNWQN